jgi:hypothetical protein
MRAAVDEAYRARGLLDRSTAVELRRIGQRVAGHDVQQEVSLARERSVNLFTGQAGSVGVRGPLRIQLQTGVQQVRASDSVRKVFRIVLWSRGDQTCAW